MQDTFDFFRKNVTKCNSTCDLELVKEELQKSIRSLKILNPQYCTLESSSTRYSEGVKEGPFFQQLLRRAVLLELQR